jgi:hypothetical protein
MYLAAIYISGISDSPTVRRDSRGVNLPAETMESTAYLIRISDIDLASEPFVGYLPSKLPSPPHPIDVRSLPTFCSCEYAERNQFPAETPKYNLILPKQQVQSIDRPS